MSIPPVKGTRDFYPEPMALRNWLVDAWRRVSFRNGFLEYDGPVMEHLDLYRAKSGEEIVSQLYSFNDRGGRELALRPEITPTLARMVNARINALPRPIKWFSVPRLFRAENPQKGRLREFFQWNVDVIGVDDVVADADCIFTAVDLLAELGLSPEDVVVRIGSRPLTAGALRTAGVAEENIDAALAALDKRPKIPEDRFARLAEEAGIPLERLGRLTAFQDAADLSAAREAIGADASVDREAEKLSALLKHLESMGAEDYCRLDLRIVRGLAYYTGTVYEVFDRAKSLRAVAGGGRYDNLLEVLGGPRVSATGFGMGDVVLSIMLEEKGKLPELAPGLDCFVVSDRGERFDEVLALVGQLRRAGLSADFSAKAQSLGKLLKEANRRGARRAILVSADGPAVKDLATGEQSDVPAEDLMANPRGVLSPGGVRE
jgi:histidyl-tRNA synthetase